MGFVPGADRLRGAGRRSSARPAAGLGRCLLAVVRAAQPEHARLLRRQIRDGGGVLTMADGTIRPIDVTMLLAPIERALQAMSLGLIALAAALAISRHR
jgi:hypothetical protein